jgi:branched-chain amino acid transport system substrate-binding protein
MTKANSADPNKVLDAVAALDTDSFFGQIKFNQTGLNVYKPMAVIQIQQGQQVAVWPKTDKTAAMRWPVATS